VAAISDVAAQNVAQPLVAYKLNNVWFVLNQNGDMLYKSNIILDVEQYSQNLLGAYVYNGGKVQSAYFDNFGEIELLTSSQVPLQIKENRVFVLTADMDKKKYAYGLVTNKAKWILDTIWLDYVDYSEGLAYIMNKDERGYIDTNGKFVFKLEKGQAGYGFTEGLSPISDAKLGKFGYINKKGKLVIPFEFEEAHNFSEGLAKVFIYNKNDKVGAFGYINKDGNVMIECKYEEATDFKEKRAFVAVSDPMDHKFLWAVIDNDGVPLTGYNFTDRKNFSDGVAAVQTDDKYWHYIDIKGKTTNNTKYKMAGSFVNGIAFVVTLDDKKQFIKKDGSVLISLPNEVEVILDCRNNERFPPQK
jgi:hypothetical protein